MTTVRLSNYQKNVLEEAKKRIDRARSCKSIYEYLTEVLHLNDRIINILKNDNPETLKMYTDEWNNKHAKMYNLAADMAELQILGEEHFDKLNTNKSEPF